MFVLDHMQNGFLPSHTAASRNIICTRLSTQALIAIEAEMTYLLMNTSGAFGSGKGDKKIKKRQRHGGEIRST